MHEAPATIGLTAMVPTDPPQRRVLTGAAALFVERGYAKTSVRQIAAHAKVSLDTVYACGGKAELFLRAVELVLSGNRDGTPLLRAPDMDAVWQAPTLHEVIAGLVGATVAADARSDRIWSAFVEGASSDPTLTAALAAQNDAMRAEGRRVIEFLKGRGLCSRKIDTARTADVIWAHAHPNRYALLVGHAGWTTEEFAAELTATVTDLLTDESTERRPSGRT